MKSYLFEDVKKLVGNTYQLNKSTKEFTSIEINDDHIRVNFGNTDYTTYTDLNEALRDIEKVNNFEENSLTVDNLIDTYTNVNFS